MSLQGKKERTLAQRRPDVPQSRVQMKLLVSILLLGTASDARSARRLVADQMKIKKADVDCNELIKA